VVAVVVETGYVAKVGGVEVEQVLNTGMVAVKEVKYRGGSGEGGGSGGGEGGGRVELTLAAGQTPRRGGGASPVDQP